MESVDASYYEPHTHYLSGLAYNLMVHTGIDGASTLAPFLDSVLYERPDDFPETSLLYQYCYWVIDQYFMESVEKYTQRLSEEIQKKEISDIAWKAAVKSCHESLKKNDCDELTYFWMEHRIGENNNKCIYFVDWLIEKESLPVYLDDAWSEYCEEILFDSDAFYNWQEKAARDMESVLMISRSSRKSLNGYLAEFNEYEMGRLTLPQWVQRHVYFRDYGCCGICGKDITDEVDWRTEGSDYYSYLTAPEDGGINDITNIQMQCRVCSE